MTPDLNEYVAQSHPDDVLAAMLLSWKVARRQLDALEAKITNAVLAKAESVTAGTVTATYYKGKTTYNYEDSCKERLIQLEDEHGTEAAKALLSSWTIIVPASKKVNWRGMWIEDPGGFCESPESAIVKSQAAPSVKLHYSTPESE